MRLACADTKLQCSVFLGIKYGSLAMLKTNASVGKEESAGSIIVTASGACIYGYCFRSPFDGGVKVAGIRNGAGPIDCAQDIFHKLIRRLMISAQTVQARPRTSLAFEKELADPWTKRDQHGTNICISIGEDEYPSQCHLSRNHRGSWISSVGTQSYNLRLL